MPERCTCGAELPPDARFCHKCGKPQREEDVEVAPPPPPIAAPVMSPALHAELAQGQRAARAASIGFRNPLAVRVALLASVIGFLFFGIAGQISALLSLVAMLGAGVFSVFLYRRRTGLPVSLAGGIHMGWITGVFSFVTAMILVTIMAVALTDQTFASVFQSQLGARSSDVDRKTGARYVSQPQRHRGHPRILFRGLLRDADSRRRARVLLRPPSE